MIDGHLIPFLLVEFNLISTELSNPEDKIKDGDRGYGECGKILKCTLTASRRNLETRAVCGA